MNVDYILCIYMQETMRKTDAPIHVKYLQTMVECLCLLGKVAAAGAMIWYVMFRPLT